MYTKLGIGLFLCVLLAQSSSFKVLNAPKLTPVPADNRVVGGWPAVDGQFPHMVYLNVGCGGALIDAKWVLTAAHCVDYSASVVVYLGGIYTNQFPINVPASRVHVHPAWNPSNLNNDIALLELDVPVTFSDDIRPIAIANSRDNLFDGEEATLAGFGYLNDAYERPTVLQYVNLTVISNAQCAEYFGMFIVETTICVVGLESPAQGSCFGDSGSGLFLRRSDGDVLIGITSFIGWEGCEGHNPSGFVRPNFYLDWIRETTGIDV